ncbi:MAG TPA: hypothetical protein VF263_05685 [Longimicrobiaceae bacterium]
MCQTVIWSMRVWAKAALLVPSASVSDHWFDWMILVRLFVGGIGSESKANDETAPPPTGRLLASTAPGGVESTPAMNGVEWTGASRACWEPTLTERLERLIR